MREGGGNYVKYLISGWNRKERRGNKKFKKGSNLDQVVGALKRGGVGGGWNPLTNYGTFLNISFEVQLIKSPNLIN